MKPTVGRIVHVWDHSFRPNANNGVGAGPYAAIIAQVIDAEAGKVGVTLFTAGGFGFAELEPRKTDQDVRYWQWPPRENGGLIL